MFVAQIDMLMWNCRCRGMPRSNMFDMDGDGMMIAFVVDEWFLSLGQHVVYFHMF
jgi:hypothetical protein